MKKLIIPALLLALAACEEEAPGETGYAIRDLLLSEDLLEPGATLVIRFTVAEPALDARTGEFHVVEQLEIYLADDPDTIAFADGAVASLTGTGEAADFTNEIYLEPAAFLPGDYELHVTCFDKVKDNRRAEATARFTVKAPPVAPVPENVQTALPQESARLP